MKVNNPNKRCFKIGEYNNINIFYHYIQNSTKIVKGMRSDEPSFYITGNPSLNKTIKQIKEYEK